MTMLFVGQIIQDFQNKNTTKAKTNSAFYKLILQNKHANPLREVQKQY